VIVKCVAVVREVAAMATALERSGGSGWRRYGQPELVVFLQSLVSRQEAKLSGDQLI
jgi:murein endopeptidase